MEQDLILGLGLPVMAALVALLIGLALLGRQLHKLNKPVVVRRGTGYRPRRRGP